MAKNEKKLNKGAEAAKATAQEKEEVIPSAEEQKKELEIDLWRWISNLEDLQIDLIDAVDAGKEKSIPKIEKQILELKDKIRAGMNSLSGLDTGEDYKAIIAEAKDILAQKARENLDKEPGELEQPKPKKKKKKIALSKDDIRNLKKLKIRPLRPKKKKKPFNMFAAAADSDAPLSERLMMLQGMLTDTVSLMKDILEEDAPKHIFEMAKQTWLAHIEVSLDMDHEWLLSLDKNMTETIEDIQDEELSEDDD